MAETNGNGVRFRIGFETILGWVIAALLAWGVAYARVAVVEDRVDTLREDVREIKADVKQILSRP